MNLRTSLSHPLRIDPLRPPAGGTVGLTLCPGKQGPSSWGGHRWQRNLSADVAQVAAWRPDLWLCLMEPEELMRWEVGAMPFVANTVCPFLHLPIRDQHAPGRRFAQRWNTVGSAVHATLRRGGRVLVHCRGGLGRAGTVAAQMLIEQGLPSALAIAMVRSARKGAIESGPQHRYLHGLDARAACR